MLRSLFARSLIIAATLAAGSTALVFANHSWGNYHWARTDNPLTLKVGDNVDPTWDQFLLYSVGAWNGSNVILLTTAPGGTSAKTCKPTGGRIEVCNAKYGRNGWLGLAQIWASGDHITQAVTKVNDTYFSSGSYNTPAWRRMVMCQELGHDFGLDHQDEKFDNPNVGSCMDYTNDPDGGPGGASETDLSNEYPNAHDYAQLTAIYQHLDSTTTATQRTNPGEAGQLDRGQFGRLVRSTNGGRTELYELDLGNGRRAFTHVIWAE